jgi:hypothetical protein
MDTEALRRVLLAMKAREPWTIDPRDIEAALAALERIRVEHIPGTEYRG